MAAWRKSPAGPFYDRVPGRPGEPAQTRALGTYDDAEAAAVQAWFGALRRRRRYDVLDALRAGRLVPVEAMELDEHGALAARLDALRAEDARAAEPDLDAWVTQWAAMGDTPTHRKYVAMVRRMIPAGTRFPVHAFTPVTIRRFLESLTQQRTGHGGRVRDTGRPAGPATRNRHRSALSVFARTLVEHGVLAVNPVKSVRGFTVPATLPIYLTPAQARALVDAMPSAEARAVVALMCNGVEWGAVANARRRDLCLDDDPPVFEAFPGLGDARGKTPARSRAVALSEAWTLAPLRAHAATLPANARLTTLTIRQLEGLFARTTRALGLPPVTPHKLRHTFAVAALKRGDDKQSVKHNLGHTPRSLMVETVYGVYLADPRSRAVARRRRQDETEG